VLNQYGFEYKDTINVIKLMEV